MIKNLFSKISNKSNISKAFKEYQSLVELESKRKSYEEEYGIEDATETFKAQEGILKNNLLTLAKVYTSYDVPVLQKKKGAPGNYEYFNMQGTPPVVHRWEEELQDEYLHKATGSVTKVVEINEVKNTEAEIIELERKFKSLNRRILKPGVYELIEKKANDKIKEKAQFLSRFFKGNEELIEKFILNDLLNSETNYDAIESIVERIRFISFLLNNSKFDLTDSEDVEVGNKTIIKLDFKQLSYHISNMSIEPLLKSFSQHKYDFALINNHI